MASKRVATLSVEAKEELAREIAARLSVAVMAARIAVEGPAAVSQVPTEIPFMLAPNVLASALACATTGLPFVVEELHREAEAQAWGGGPKPRKTRTGPPQEGGGSP